MHRNPTEFRARFKAWKEGKDVYEAGRPIEIQIADNSNANFIERLKSPIREAIPAWEDPYHSIATHKMAYSSYDDADLIFPLVYKDKDGKLKDWTNPYTNKIGPMEWNREKIFDAAEESAKQRKDTLWLPKGKGEWFTTNYKKYYPGFGGGKDDELKPVTYFKSLGSADLFLTGMTPIVGTYNDYVTYKKDSSFTNLAYLALSGISDALTLTGIGSVLGLGGKALLKALKSSSQAVKASLRALLMRKAMHPARYSAAVANALRQSADAASNLLKGVSTDIAPNLYLISTAE